MTQIWKPLARIVLMLDFVVKRVIWHLIEVSIHWWHHVLRQQLSYINFHWVLDGTFNNSSRKHLKYNFFFIWCNFFFYVNKKNVTTFGVWRLLCVFFFSFICQNFYFFAAFDNVWCGCGKFSYSCKTTIYILYCAFNNYRFWRGHVGRKPRLPSAHKGILSIVSMSGYFHIGDN